jgi:signal transduction histidine kinase
MGVRQGAVMNRGRKLTIAAICVVLVAVSLGLSMATGDADLLFAVVLICPLAAAALAGWSAVWQAAVALICLTSFAIGDHFLAVPGAFAPNRWIGLLAAILIAQVITRMLGRSRRAIREQLRNLEQETQLRERETATIAHDIRNPLGALAGFVNLLQDGRLSEAERADVLARMETIVRRVDLVVGNILALFRLDEGRPELRPRPIDPDRVAREIAAGFKADTDRKGVRIVTEFGARLRANLDPFQFERIVANLLANAAARSSSGEIRIATAAQDSGLRIEVVDAGPTPSDAELAQMFERPGPSEMRANTNRLGLYLARVFVEAAGGRIEATSRDGGGGLRVTAELPVESTKNEAQ